MQRYRDPLVVLVLIALPFVFYVANSKAPRDHNMVDRVVVFISIPVQWAVVNTLDGVSNLWRRYVALVNVERDNEALRDEVGRLRAELAAREELLHANARLRALVGLKEQEPQVPMLLASVVAMSPTPLFRSVRVNRGSADGVEPGTPVVSHEGVVGRVAAVSTHHADVMLLVDTNSSVDVLVQRNRARARIRGTGGDGRLGLTVQYLARTADVEPGDVLITSGTGNTFPKGLPVGTIIEVQRRAFGLYQEATVVPAVDFGRLEAVMLLPSGFPKNTNFEPAPGPHAPLLADDDLLPRRDGGSQTPGPGAVLGSP